MPAAGGSFLCLLFYDTLSHHTCFCRWVNPEAEMPTQELEQILTQEEMPTQSGMAMQKEMVTQDNAPVALLRVL